MSKRFDKISRHAVMHPDKHKTGHDAHVRKSGAHKDGITANEIHMPHAFTDLEGYSEGNEGPHI